MRMTEVCQALLCHFQLCFPIMLRIIINQHLLSTYSMPSTMLSTYSLTYLKFRVDGVPFYRNWGLRGFMVTYIVTFRTWSEVFGSQVWSSFYITVATQLFFCGVSSELVRTNLEITLRSQFNTEGKTIERCKVERTQTVFIYWCQ